MPGRPDRTIATAESVDKALVTFERQRPDVVLCDVAMPGRDGFDFLRDARRRRADVPVAAPTAHARVDDRDRMLAEGFRAHIAKPVDPLDLVREVARLAPRR